MNSSRLQHIFAEYIKQFELINNKNNDETYKWAVVQAFQDGFDIDATDFAGMLTGVWKQSENLLDNKTQLPFYALVDYSRNEPQAVRQLFADLYADDGGNLEARQAKIIAFIAGTEELRKKYRPDSWRYINDQRAAMTYLFLHDPDHNYLYKATQAHEFADCVEFYNDWGSGSNFKLGVYYKMCDELVELMSADTALMDTCSSRFEKDKRALYRDNKLHILAFDIIYSSQVYGLYNGLEYSHPDSQAKRLYLERELKAKQLQAAFYEAQSKAEELAAVKSYLQSVVSVGASVGHKAFGHGIIEESDGEILTVHFDSTNETKRFSLLSSIGGGFIVPNIPDITDCIKKHSAIMKAEQNIMSKLKSSEAALEPYQEYL